MSEKKYKVSVENEKGSEITITAEIPTDEFESFRKEAVKGLAKDAEVPGFRKGKVPEKVLTEKVGESTILYNMAEKAISQAYPQILAQEKIEAISQPQINITKIAAGNPLEFKVKTAIMPDVNLADYKKIAKSILKEGREPAEVTDEEVSSTLMQIRKNLAQNKGSDGNQDEDDNQDKDKQEPPELTNEDVKKFGDYKNVADFKTKVKGDLLKEKERKAKEKVRLEIMEKIIEESDIEIPDVLVEAELDKMMHQFRHDIKRMGVEVDDYFEKIGKSEDEMIKEWRPDAKKRVALQLLLLEISKKENLKANPEEIEKETKHLLSHKPEADEANVRAYFEHALTNEAVFKFLEEQK